MASNRRTVAKWLVVAALVPVWWFSAPVRGYMTAEFDVQRGRYIVLGYGLPHPWQAEYVRLLRERYGIQYRPVAGCLVSWDMRWYVDAYNGVSTAAGKQKFGRDIFKEAADEAHKEFHASVPAPAGV